MSIPSFPLKLCCDRAGNASSSCNLYSQHNTKIYLFSCHWLERNEHSLLNHLLKHLFLCQLPRRGCCENAVFTACIPCISICLPSCRCASNTVLSSVCPLLCLLRFICANEQSSFYPAFTGAVSTSHILKSIVPPVSPFSQFRQFLLCL